MIFLAFLASPTRFHPSSGSGTTITGIEGSWPLASNWVFGVDWVELGVEGLVSCEPETDSLAAGVGGGGALLDSRRPEPGSSAAGVGEGWGGDDLAGAIGVTLISKPNALIS